jgi:hypothetical protein
MEKKVNFVLSFLFQLIVWKLVDAYVLSWLFTFLDFYGILANLCMGIVIVGILYFESRFLAARTLKIGGNTWSFNSSGIGIAAFLQFLGLILSAYY